MAKSKHEETWDDSELVTSWNEALEEYKKYHSLAAKGEKIDLVLEQAEKNGLKSKNATIQAEQSNYPAAVNGNAAASTSNTAPTTTAGAELTTQPLVQMPAAGTTTAMPQALMNSVQDEGLKNMMMSWYYAGYYTGLYEGQQKAYAAVQEQQRGS